MPNLYQSAVADMSDEELRILSDELKQAHECSSADDEDWPEDSYWDDAAAEERYLEMLREMHRRFMLPNHNPGWERATPNFYVQEVMKCLARNMEFASRVNREFNQPFAHIGDTITVRKPYRFTRKDYIG